MASRAAVKRLTIEYKSFQESPPPYIDARPFEDDILHWCYLITGPPDTPFAGGMYMGEVKCPPEYPFKPPSIRMITPSGRFEPGERLCLNMSDFHPETWNPAWNLSSILIGLLSFMCSKETATGAMNTSDQVRRELAQRSVKWNLANKTFQTVFPDIVEEIRQAVPNIDSVTTVEVVPPSSSDLVNRIFRFRPMAYKEARERAANVEKHLSEKEEEATEDAPESDWTMMAIIAGLVLAVGILAYSWLKV